MPCAFAVRERFDLDDLGPQKAEHLRGIRAVENVREVQDAEIVERTHAAFLDSKAERTKRTSMRTSSAGPLDGQLSAAPGKGKETQEINGILRGYG